MGLNAVDHICVIPRFPHRDEKLRMDEFRRTAGGQVASALVACSRWGLKVKYVGKVGADDMGDFSLDSLRGEGIDIEDVKRVDGAVNQFAFILVEGTTGERTIIWKRDAALAIEPDEVPVDAVGAGRVILLDGHDAPAAARAAALARKASAVVVVDAETVKPGTEDLIAGADYVVASRQFPERFTGERDIEKALDVILRAGPRCAVATLGREGAVSLSPEGLLRSRGFKVKCLDSTGAGDVFHGAFVFGLARDWELPRILEFSNAAAALNCTSIGARGGIGSMDEISTLMESGPRW
jgi:sulfofructose kinase